MTKWSLCGLIIQLSNKALDYDQRAVKAEKDFLSTFPMLHIFLGSLNSITPFNALW